MQMHALEPKEFGEFNDKCSVLKEWRASQLSIPDIVIDDKEFTAWLVFPAQPEIRAERICAGVVLQ